ncbi:hypothetical protein HAX54_010270, partial [Datura stramonium]|nr:hypothetical protein [Datura stramonium]
INEVRSKEGKNHKNAVTVLDRLITDLEVQTSALGHKKAEGWDFEHLTGEHSGELLMQKRVPLTADPVCKPPVNNRRRHSELGIISSVKGKVVECRFNSANRRSSWLQAVAWVPCCSGSSQIGTGDSPPRRQ